MQETFITAPDGHQIQAYIWPNEHSKAWVHINHGMAEHIGRYQVFAEKLVQAGYAVVGHNHRGHGSSPTTQLGFFAEHDGWQKVLQDISLVRQSICTDQKPYYIFAHSMGSFINQAYLTSELIEKPAHINGLILSGSNFQPTLLSKAGLMAAKLEKLRVGSKGSSKLINFLSFGSFNKTFKPNRTEFDWLSRDQQQVDKYINDPLCGFDCSTGLWCDLFEGLIDVYKKDSFKRVQKNIPVHIFGGDKDPVGLMGKGLPKLAKSYKDAGFTQTSLKMYENARHEMLNETNAQDVMEDVISWLNNQIESTDSQCA